MNRTASFLSLSLTTAAICLLAGLPAAAQAAAPGTVDLIATPPELTAKVAPNVVLTFDDSGSMGRNYMPDQRPYSGAGWGATDQQNTSGSATWPSGGKPYLCAGIIDPRVTNPSDPRSWPMNGVYYNPNSTYLPPLKADGSSFPNASFTAAWDNGIIKNRPSGPVASTTRNLGTNARFCDNTAGYYRLKTGVLLTLDANGALDTASLGRLFTTGNWEWVALPAAEKQNFANWYSYYHTRYSAAVSGISHAYADFDHSIRVAHQNINTRMIVASTKVLAFEDLPGRPTRTDFYDWLFATPVSGNTPNQTAAQRVGELFKRNTGASDTNPYWDPDTSRELSCRKNFHIQMTDGMWNNSTVTVSQTDTKAVTLPDGRAYSVTAPESAIFWNEGSSAQNTMANIAFHYWATDLRPDFMGNPQTKLKVRPYLLDSTTGITGSVPLNPGDKWLDNQEIYWNPVNDPASWPHLVQFMIGFGVSGTIPNNTTSYLELRKGNIAWPKLDGTGTYTDNNKKIDDMWHAALNSRGEFFSAGSPDELIAAVRKIIASVVAQSSSSTAKTVALPIVTGAGDNAYGGGYDTTGWLGSVRRFRLDAAGNPSTTVWDAGCLLTGGACLDPGGTNPVRNPNSRVIVTSDGAGTGKAFRHGSLTTAQQYALNTKPGATATCTTASGPNCDNKGLDRVDYLRGDRSSEAGSAPLPMRARMSVLGAIVNSDVAYVSSPRAGYNDIFPPGSPEANAAAADPDHGSYFGYQNDQRGRLPMIYVGSDDGMLHAFNADSGAEEWAYVPNALISNGRLARSTVRDVGLVPGVDSQPRERDVFINGKWRTILLGSLRLGGRGVYAVDVTNPHFGSEANAIATGGLTMWEFTNGPTASSASDDPCSAGATSCPSLGYTYDSGNIMRLHAQDRWAAIVSSGYFPQDPAAAANPNDVDEAAANRTSLLVIDLATGKLIRELRTDTAPQWSASYRSYGLSTPMVYDLGADDIDDLAYAGDLAGNLWRFDLSDPNPSNWKVDLMFRTTGSGGAANVGDQPIVFNPSALTDPVTRGPVLVFGTGKYLGEEDRTSAIPQQAYYGIRDYGTRSPNYPIKVNQLVTQILSQAGDETRSITGYANPSSPPSGVPQMRIGSNLVYANGWRIPLNIGTEKGERAQRRAIPLPSANIALLYGLIPKSDDPCDPGARYSIMGVDAGTGGALAGGGLPGGTGLVGAVLAAGQPPSDPSIRRGVGGAIIVGLPDGLPTPVKEALDEVMERAFPPWHRDSWRELQDL